MVLEILTKNRVYENIDLYSDENKCLFQLRGDIIEKVVRSMARDVMKVTTDKIVNEYLNKRFKSQTIDEQDPMRRFADEMLRDVMLKMLKQ